MAAGPFSPIATALRQQYYGVPTQLGAPRGGAGGGSLMLVSLVTLHD